MGFDCIFVVSRSRRTGGLGHFWNNSIKFELLNYSQYHLAAKIDGVGPDPWRLTLFYGEAQIPERYKTWDTIKGLAATSNLPWIAVSDFNEVLNLSDHNGIGIGA